MLETDNAKAYVDAYYRALAGFPERKEDTLTILLYHGVTDSSSTGIENYTNKHVSVADFRRDMTCVKKHCTILSMDDVVEICRNGDAFPPRAVAITFDDGFANNHSVAAPILADLNLPATFYVCAGVVNTDLMFWVDELEDCFNRTDRESVTVELEGHARRFELRSDLERIAALDAVKAVCKRVPCEEKNRILDTVRSTTGIIPGVAQAENYRKITWSALRELASDPAFIVGGHTLYHDILALQETERAALDVRTCLDLLSFNVGKPVTHFSYPEGQANNYDEAIIQVLTERGVVCSPSAICGLNSKNEHLFHLRRVMVGVYGLPMPFRDPAFA